MSLPGSRGEYLKVVGIIVIVIIDREISLVYYPFQIMFTSITQCAATFYRQERIQDFGKGRLWVIAKY